MIPTKHIEVKTAAGQSAAFLSPKSDSLKECYIDTRLNGESTLEFQLPLSSEKWAELTPECTIWAGGRVFSMLKDEAVDTVRDESGKLWGKAMLVERWAELDKSYIEPSLSNDPLSPTPADLAVIIVSGGSDLSGGRYPVGSAAHALYAVLNGSGWSVGTVDVTGTHDLEMEKVSRLALIKEIQNIWGGYLVWDSVNKTVSLRSGNTWQNYTGFQIRYKKNLKHITRTQSNRIITKLYPFGHDDLDIASVNGGKKYLTNNTFSPHEYTGIYKNQDIYDAQELKEKATAELSLICRPRYLYNVKMVDLRTLPEYSHEDFSVGDMVDVIDPDVAPESPKVRIIRHKYNLFHPWDCELEIGDPQERLIEKLKASFSTTGFVDSKFNGNGKISGQSIEDLTITADKIADLSINAEKIEDLTITADKIANLTITGSKIANATITDAKIVSLSADKITAGTIDASIIDVINLNADNIVTGTLSADRIDTTNLYAERIKQTGYPNNYGIIGGPLGGLALYQSGNHYFSIYKGALEAYFYAIDDNFLSSSGYSTYAYNDWDFSLANVTGLDNYALASHDHDERYIRPQFLSNLCRIDYSSSLMRLNIRDTSGVDVGYIDITPV